MLMLSILHVVYRAHPPSAGKHILVACGPGNNGAVQPIYLALKKQYRLIHLLE